MLRPSPTTTARMIGDWPDPANPVTIGTSAAATTAANASAHRCGDILRNLDGDVGGVDHQRRTSRGPGRAAGDVVDHLIEAPRAAPTHDGDSGTADHADLAAAFEEPNSPGDGGEVVVVVDHVLGERVDHHHRHAAPTERDGLVEHVR